MLEVEFDIVVDGISHRVKLSSNAVANIMEVVHVAQEDYYELLMKEEDGQADIW